MIKEKEQLLIELKKRNVPDEIIKAFAVIKKENFIPEAFQVYTYDDVSIPLTDGSKIPPFSSLALVLMLAELKQGQKILEIGSGSGYLLALISEIVKTGKIYGMEINLNLAVSSKKNLEKNSDIEIINSSGSQGFKNEAPYDRIIVSFSFDNKNQLNPLVQQLKDDGILVAPISDSLFQFNKADGRVIENEFKNYRFVPMIK